MGNVKRLTKLLMTICIFQISNLEGNLRMQPLEDTRSPNTNPLILKMKRETEVISYIKYNHQFEPRFLEYLKIISALSQISS